MFRGLYCGDRGVSGCLGDPPGVDSPFCPGGKHRPCHPSTCAGNHVTKHKVAHTGLALQVSALLVTFFL